MSFADRHGVDTSNATCKRRIAMAVVRFRRREGDYFAVSRSEIATVWDSKDAQEWAEAIADSADFRRLADPRLPRQQLDAVAAQLMRGDVLIVRVAAAARLMDDPSEITNLADLISDASTDPAQGETESWIAFHVVDQRGRPLPFFRGRLQDPTGAEHAASLDTRATARVSKLDDDGLCSLTLEVDPGRIS
jgi:hypothetical protein